MTALLRIYDGAFHGLEIERETDSAALLFVVEDGGQVAVTIPLASLRRLNAQLTSRLAEYEHQRRRD